MNRKIRKTLRTIKNGRLLAQHLQVKIIYRNFVYYICFFQCESEGSNPPADLEWFLQGKKIPNSKVTNYVLLVWEPSVAQVTHSYFCRLPALERFYRETKFSLLKSNHVQLRILKLRTFPWVSRVPQSKFEANRSRGS